MKTTCVHCGQPFEAAPSASGSFTCPACGKATPAETSSSARPKPGPAAGPTLSRFRRRDLLIFIAALLAVLVLLFLRHRPSEVQHLVFGDFGPGTASGSHAEAVSNGLQPGSAPGTVSGTGGHASSGSGGAGNSGGFAGNDTSNPQSSDQTGAGGAVNGSRTIAGESPAAPRSLTPVKGTDSGAVPDSIQKETGELDKNPASPTEGLGGAGLKTGAPPSSTAGSGGSGPGGAGTSGSGSAGPAGGSVGAKGSSGPGAGEPGSGLPSAPGATTAPGGSPGAAAQSQAAGRGPGSGSGPGSSANPGSAQGTGAGPGASGSGANSGAGPNSSGQGSGSAAGSTPGAAGGAQPSGGTPRGPAATPPSDAPSAPRSTFGLIGALRNDINDRTPDTTPAGVAKQKTDDLLELAKNQSQNPADAQGPQPFDPKLGTNIVFVLDRSTSMNQDGNSQAAARRALVNTLAVLDTNQTFYVLFFPLKEMPAPGPVRATAENVRAMADWISSVAPAERSDPAQAILRGLHFSPDTLWLLSDGQFSPDVARTVRDANEPVKAQINTIGFYNRNGEPVLRQIADENQGTYRFVPRPTSSSGSGLPSADTSGQ